MDYYEKERLAKDEKTSPEILEELSRDEYCIIRYTAISNLNIPGGTLIRLSEDKDWRIRSWVASNSSTPESGLIRLSQDKSFYVRRKAIKNKNLGGILKEMVRVILGEEGKIDWLKFGNNKIGAKFSLGFLTSWEGEIF